jgi:hypothetical protein
VLICSASALTTMPGRRVAKMYWRVPRSERRRSTTDPYRHVATKPPLNTSARHPGLGAGQLSYDVLPHGPARTSTFAESGHDGYPYGWSATCPNKLLKHGIDSHLTMDQGVDLVMYVPGQSTAANAVQRPWQPANARRPARRRQTRRRSARNSRRPARRSSTLSKLYKPSHARRQSGRSAQAQRRARPRFGVGQH